MRAHRPAGDPLAADPHTRAPGRPAAPALYLYADAAALLISGLSVLIPPVSVLAVGFFIWLRLGGRRREGEKHAGLRILR